MPRPSDPALEQLRTDLQAATAKFDYKQIHWLAAFKRGGEEPGKFSRALSPFAGHVPEALIVSAIDAIAFRVLPRDAFDPCRDPAACPKLVSQRPTALPGLRLPTFCVSIDGERHLAVDDKTWIGAPTKHDECVWVWKGGRWLRYCRSAFYVGAPSLHRFYSTATGEVCSGVEN
jgi:hypothetical protein